MGGVLAWVGEFVGALLTPTGGRTLSASLASSGGRRMPGRGRLLLVAVVVGLPAVYAAYALLLSTPRPAEVPPPVLVDTGERLPEVDVFAELARTDPVRMLETGINRYRREVKGGFRAALHKRERIGGVLHPAERVRVAVRVDPPAVSFIWEEGARKDIVGSTPVAVLWPYADEKAPDRLDPAAMAVWRPDAWIKYKQVDVKGDLARGAARYCIKEAGFDRSMLRTHAAWLAARERGDAPPEYLGLQPVERLGGRLCHVVRRTCPTPEADSFALDEARPTDGKKLQKDGFDRVTIMVDRHTWLQVGTEITRANGEVVAEYYFRDVELFPEAVPAEPFNVETIKAVPATKR